MRKRWVCAIGCCAIVVFFAFSSAFSAELNATAASNPAAAQVAASNGAPNVPRSLVEKAARFYGEERWPGCRMISITPYYAFDGSINAYAVQFAKKGSPLADEAAINAQFLLGERQLDEVKSNRPTATVGPDSLPANDSPVAAPMATLTTAGNSGPSSGGVSAVLPATPASNAVQAPEETLKRSVAHSVWTRQIKAAAHGAVLPDQVGTVIIAARYDLYPLLERFDGVAPHIHFQTKVRRLAAIPKDQPNPVARTFYVGPMAYFHEPATPQLSGIGTPAQVINPLDEQVLDLSGQQRAALPGRLPAAEPGKCPIPPEEFWNAIDLQGAPPKTSEPQPLGTPSTAILGVPYYHQDDYGAASCGPVASSQALGYWDDNGHGNLVDNGFSTTGHEEELIYNLMRAEGYSPSVGTYGSQIKPGIEAVTNTNPYGRNLNVTVSWKWTGVAWSDITTEINARRPFVMGNFDTAHYPYWAHFTTGVGYTNSTNHLLYVNYNYPPDAPYELNWDNIANDNDEIYKVNRSATTMFDCPWSEDFEGDTASHWDRGSNGGPYWGDTAYRAHNSTPNPSPPGGALAWSAYCVRSGVAPPGPYPKNADNWMIYGPFSTVGKSSGEFSAYIWRHIPQPDGDDWVALFASLDGSNFSGTGYWGDHRSWERCTLNLTSVYGLGNVMNRANVWLAVWFHSDGNDTVGEGAYVDDVAIRLYPVSPFTFMLPKAGDMYLRGTTHDIKWGGTGDLGLGLVRIDLYKGGALYSTISGGASNSGIFSWPVPASLPWGSDYRIKLSRVGTPTTYAYSPYFEIYPPPSITVVNPNGGELWQRETTKYVLWSWAGYPGTTVKIELRKNNVYERTIAYSVPNNGFYPWAIPASQPTGTDYKIRVTSWKDGTIFDQSDTNFSIIIPNIAVVRPLGGDWWQKIKTYDIVWKWQGNPTPLSRIDLYLGRTIFPIAGAVSNQPDKDGLCRFHWTIPTSVTAASGYRIKVTSLGGQGLYDYSETFRIVDQDALHLTSPNGGEYWLRGSNHNIEWVSTLTEPKQVKIDLYKAGVFQSTITSSTDNDGTFTWTIPNTIPTGSDYRVRIALTSPTTVFDFTDTTFRIGAPQIAVLWPPGGAVFTPGTFQTIQWQSSDILAPSPHVRIELYRDGAFDSLITSSTADNGAFRWLIPPSLPPGPHLRIRIASLADPSIVGFSEDGFSVVSLPAIQLTSPNGSERWLRGSQHVILWRSNGLPDTDAKLELYNKSGRLYGLIATTRLLDGAFAWKVPFTLPPGQDYMIKITSLYDPAVFDWSDVAFSVLGNTSVRGSRWSLY